MNELKNDDCGFSFKKLFDKKKQAKYIFSLFFSIIFTLLICTLDSDFSDLLDDNKYIFFLAYSGIFSIIYFLTPLLFIAFKEISEECQTKENLWLGAVY